MCVPTQPFKIESEWVYRGLHCAVTQVREGQHRCGYVRVPPGHPLHSADYDSLAACHLRAHGGMNFAEIEPCVEHPDGQGWWFGFDCAHAFDRHWDPALDPDTLSPGTRELYDTYQRFPMLRDGPEGAHYWTLAEVEAECEKLADQLVVVESVHG